MTAHEEIMVDFRRGERVTDCQKKHKCVWCGKPCGPGDNTVHENDSDQTLIGYACVDETDCLTYEQKCVKADTI